MIKGGIRVVLACLAASVFGDWPTYHGAPDLKGVSDAVLSDRLELAWRYNAGGEVNATPVSDGERIFFAASKGRVVALDLTGSMIWERSFKRVSDSGQELALRFEAPPACWGGLVFAGSTRGTLFALDARSGETKWTYETGGILVASPNFIPPSNTRKTWSVVVLDQSEGALHCLEGTSGSRLWKTEGVERCDGAPGVGDDRIVFGSCLAALHVYSVKGEHLKDVELGGDGQVAGGVAVDGTRAFAGARDGSLVCVDLEVGDVAWSGEEAEDQAFSTPVVLSNRVVYCSDDGQVYAVDRAAGKLVWTFDTGGVPYSPVATKDRVVVSADGALYVLGLETGAKLWSKEVGDDITSPAIIGGLVVVGADDGTVSAYRGMK